MTRKLLLLLLLGLPVASPSFGQVVAQVDASSWSPANIVSYPGAFRLSESGMVAACAPGESGCVRGMGGGRPGSAGWVVGNLGLTSEQFLQAEAGQAGDATLAAVGRAVRLEKSGGATHWELDSSKLPAALHSEVPGSGVFFHMQDRLRPVYRTLPPVFDDGHSKLLVSADVAMPVAAVSGGATTTVTMGVILQTLDEAGSPRPVPLIVGLFNSRGLDRERIGSDGRMAFATSPYGGGGSYMATEGDAGPLAVGVKRRVFAFSLSPDGVRRVIEDLNARREMRLQTDPALVRLVQVDVRDESRFLDRGDVHVALDVGWVKAERR
jgi:hypothetical protein